MTTWTDQSLTFTYYFPALGDVFTGSPISFVADGSSHLSTLASLDPATFSVTSIAQNELQISYSYPTGAFNLTNSSFNGFTITGPGSDSPILAAFVDPSSTVTGLIDSAISFAPDSVAVNLAGDQFPAGSVGLIDVQFSSPVPLPSSWSMMILGFCSLFIMVRHRRNRAMHAS